eukprot:m.977247 g.977247  ORF g.977247 m.977247 type:complete len:853 (-) comp23950_c1_seq10:2693-5251(-)
MGRDTQKKNSKGRLDKFYHLAKETGFRARSAFKLLQLDRKYEFLKNAKVCIDLCAAPGSWMQVAVRQMPAGAVVIGVDLVPIKPVKGAIGITADITSEKCRQALKKELRHLKANVVLNDGAPNVGKDWNQDAFTQSGLVLMSLKLATEWLNQGGTFVTKVFRSRDYNKLMYILKQFFSKVQATKPQSSRNVSAEIFVVCQGYLAPAKIDPRLLDPKIIFSEIEDEQARKTNIFDPAQKQRQRVGYEEGNVGLHKTCPVGTYMASDGFLDILAENNALTFTDDDAAIMKHPSTDDEIIELVKDLKVLGKKDFKILIKWRKDIRAWMDKQDKHEEDDVDEGDAAKEKELTKEEQEEAEQAKLEEIVQEVKERKELEKRREKRKKSKLRSKALERQALNIDQPMDVDDIIQDAQLFAMKQIKSKQVLSAIDDGQWMDMEEEDEAGVQVPVTVCDVKRGVDYAQELEDELDQQYDEYRERKGMKKKFVRLGNKSKVIGAAVDPNADAPDTDYVPEVDDGSDSDTDEDDDTPTADADANPLLAKRDGATAAQRTASLWFAQSQFADLEDEEEEDDDDDANDADFGVPSSRRAAKRRKTAVKGGPVATGGDTAGDDRELKALIAQEAEEEAAAAADAQSEDEDSDEDEEEDGENKPDFEEVAAAARAPAPATGNLDAHGLALAAEMILRRKKREVLDNAYNRYTSNDGPLPTWFEDEEDRHRQPQIPMTKEMARDIKERQREINERPIKKVMEAKARAKRNVHRQMEKLKSKATAITDSDALTDREKTVQIQALYKKTKIGEKHEKPTIIVARKGHQGKRPAAKKGEKGRSIVVDKRFRSDLAGKKRLEQKKKRGRRH